MSVFEILMLVCFGAAWPFSIYKSWKTRQIAGKSVVFLAVIFCGYVSGTIHKLFYHLDYVVILYILNGVMVLTDMVLYFRNRLYRIRASAGDAGQGVRALAPSGEPDSSRKGRAG